MTGRERIEQAAKENWWNLTQESATTTLYWTPEGERIRVRYTTSGRIQWVEGTPYRSRQTSNADQVIAYLQQHKEAV